MKLQTIARRGTAAAAVLALSVTLAACGSEDDGGSDNAGDSGDTMSEAASRWLPPRTTEEGTGAAAGTFGEGCAAIPDDRRRLVRRHGPGPGRPPPPAPTRCSRP